MRDFETYVNRRDNIITIIVLDNTGAAHFELFRYQEGKYHPIQWGVAEMDGEGNVMFPGTNVSKRTMCEVAELLAQVVAGAEFPRSAFVPTANGAFRIPFTSLGPAVKEGNRWFDLRPLTLKQKKR